MSNTSIQLRKSGVTGNVPVDLNFGELALNYADKKLYYKNANNDIDYFTTGSPTDSFSTINVNSTLIFATSNTDVLSFAGANGISVIGDGVHKTVTIDGSQILAIQAGIDNTQNTHILAISSTAQGAYNQANSALQLAQNAYDYANTISGGGGSGAVNIIDDTNSNNVVYLNFTRKNSGNTNSLYVSNNIVFDTGTNTLSVNAVQMTANTNLSSNTFPSISTGSILDSFSVTKYRSAFYQIQINHLLEFHILNLNIVHDHPGTAVYASTFGEIVTNVPLGTFSYAIDPVTQLLNITFNPTYPTLTDVTFHKTMFSRIGITVPVGDLGFVNEPVTVSFDAGYDLDPAQAEFNYGTVP
jgi:hypothetical protein